MALDQFINNRTGPFPLPPGQPAESYGYGPEWLFYRMMGAQPPAGSPPAPAPGGPAPQQGNIFGTPAGSEAGSQTRLGDMGPGGHRANVGLGGGPAGGDSNYLAVAPGMASIPFTGLSYGTGIKQTGQMHDVVAWNPGDMAGSILGGITEIPGAGSIAGFVGGRVSPSYAVSDYGPTTTDNGRNIYAQDVVNNPDAYNDELSSREIGAADEAMASVPYMTPATARAVPIMQGGYGAYTPAEAALRRAAGMGMSLNRPTTWTPNRHAGGQMTGGQAVSGQARQSTTPTPPPRQPSTPFTVTRTGSTTEHGHNISSKSKGSGPSGVSSGKSYK